MSDIFSTITLDAYEAIYACVAVPLVVLIAYHIGYWRGIRWSQNAIRESVDKQIANL